MAPSVMPIVMLSSSLCVNSSSIPSVMHSVAPSLLPKKFFSVMLSVAQCEIPSEVPSDISPIIPSQPVDMTKFTFERYSAVFNCSIITTQAIRIFNFWLVHIVSI